MAIAPIPKDDEVRVQSLRDTGLLDCAPPPAFERMVTVAARLLDAPIAMIALVDSSRQWLAGQVGFPHIETPREHGLGNLCLLNDAPVVLSDLSNEEYFQGNPFVFGEPGIRAMVALAIHSSDGQPIGAFCVCDTVVRGFDDNQIKLLQDLAFVIDELIVSQKAVERAQIAETRLVEAVDVLPDGFALFDNQDRLVLFNERYCEIYADIQDIIRPGVTFEEMCRTGLERGLFPAAVGQEQAWLEERLAEHRMPRQSHEQQLPGNRWLRIEERPTNEGGLVGFRIDITELKRQQQRLEALASIDSLTNVANRRHFLELLQAEFERSHRQNFPMAFILLDVDHFKRINDTKGHSAGDKVLAALGETIRKSIRPYDRIGRIGGEEFGIFIPNICFADAIATCERLRQAIADLGIEHHGSVINFTVSMGLTELDHRLDEKPEAMFERADKALYSAKANGRDCVAELRSGQPTAQPLIFEMAGLPS